MRLSMHALSVLFLLAILWTDSLWLGLIFFVSLLGTLAVSMFYIRRDMLLTLILLSAAAVIPVVKWFEPIIAHQATESTTQALNAELNGIEKAVQQFFLNSSAMLDSLTMLLSLSKDVDSDNYNRWLTQVLPSYRNQFLNVALSEDLIIKTVYPSTEANNRLVGLYLGDVPKQGLLYRNANVTRLPVIIGPVMLLQGVPGLIYVRPIDSPKEWILSGVLSFEFLRDEIDLLKSDNLLLTMDIESLVDSFRLFDENTQKEQYSVSRRIQLEGLDITLSASLPEADQVVYRAQIKARLYGLLFWLGLSVILVSQHLNYRHREQHQLALAKNRTELINAQRLGQMGSWWSDNFEVLMLSEPLQDLLQKTSTELPQQDFFSLLHPNEVEPVRKQLQSIFDGKEEAIALEHRMRLSDHYHWFEHRIARHGEHQYSGIVRDIQELKQRDEQLAQLESFDSLTGVANRHYFKHLTIQNLALCERRKTRLALAIINIDDFRSINDKFGQLQGDELLKQVSIRLKAAARRSDSIARLSGDTFALALIDVGNNKEPVLVIEQILAQLKECYPLREDVYPQFSIGLAMYPDDGGDYDTLLQMAESALSAAKTNARGYYRFYSAELSEQTERRQNILARIPIAIRNNHFYLLFQPRVSGQDGSKICSMEALIRWQDPELDFVSPGEFIPIAEETSLIGEIGQWVLKETFAKMAEHQHQLDKDITVSINLSPRQLADPNLVSTINDLLRRYSVDAQRFELEITEYSISGEPEAIISNMHQLSDLGFKFAMDDFGTGYSNLGILQSLPLNILKVDMSFIRQIGSSTKSDELVRAILYMGHTLGLSVVAEGVETAEQVDFLRRLGCEELQGFYYYKPIPIDDIIQILRG